MLACVGAAAATGCVPRGAPPAGRKIVADRISAPVAFVRPIGDGSTRLLVSRAGQDEASVDLWVVTIDAAGTAPAERLLVANVQVPNALGCAPGPLQCTDSRGRLILATGDQQFTRIDPVTGDRTDFGFPLLSPSHDRLFVESAAGDVANGSITIYESDDQTVQLDAPHQAQFVGEVLYYVTAQQQLMRLAAGSAPELVTTGVTDFNTLNTTGDPLLALARPTSDPAVTTGSILDVVTGQETPLPPGVPFYGATISSDGRWIATLGSDGQTLRFTDRLTGAQDSFGQGPFVSNYGWRPGRDEVWLDDGNAPDPTIWIVRPGQPPVQTMGSLFGERGSAFTPDSRYWLSWTGTPDQQGVLQIGSADDPTGPRVNVIPPGTNLSQYWQLADGRLLVAVWTRTPDRANVLVFDPTTGDSRAMGEQGAVIAVGQTRVLVNQHLAENEGDLTVFELATGTATVLAPEFALAATVEPVGADPVAPQAHIAFRYVAPFPSDYDGIWLATVP